ncbi:MAG: helix-turn-helix transcriptional regulator [Lachnospiraceae bacterium]|nr:helix-turn-helix transcriptional regulator [Lachnospiraceae bacterium]
MENDAAIVANCHKYAKYLAKEVNKYLKKNNISIREFAEKSGLSESTIKRIRKGEFVPSYYSISAMSVCMGKDLWFMGTEFGIRMAAKSLIDIEVFLELIDIAKLELKHAKIIRDYLDLLIRTKEKEKELRSKLRKA